MSRVLIGHGRRQFHAWATRIVAIADWNGDGRSDIAVAIRGDLGVQYICLNRGNGRFDAPCLAVAEYSATTITPADIDRDDRVDLVVAHRDGGQEYVYLNCGSATPRYDCPDATQSRPHA